MSCKFVASDQPRILVGRHSEACEDEACAGCQPCTEAHCRVCGVTHSDGACPGCLDEVRENLTEIVRMHHSLPDEVATRGIDGEAFNLLGPAADPEARGHIEASVLAGRVDPDYLGVVPRDKEGNPLPDNTPLWTLESWSMVYRDAFEHDEPSTRAEVSEQAGYLERNLSYMATFEWVPFEDFARDLRRCVAHLEAVLHDGEQVDRGAPCMACEKPLERTWGDDSTSDGWKCPRCKTTSTDAQYRFAVAHLHREEATHLTDRDMEIRTGVKAGTVRVWANRGLIGRHVDSGRTMYAVDEVESEARQRGLLAS